MNESRFDIAVAQLFASADRSTFLHEAGHSFLESYRDVSAASPALQAGWDELSSYLGLGADGQLGDEARERFARAFEAYLKEGKAPSPRLQAVFEQFASWLRPIYRQMSELNAPIGEEVRGIFERMRATDAEHARSRDPLRVNEDAMLAGIRAAQPAGGVAKLAGNPLALLNPALRVLQSPARATRSVAAALFENPIYLKKNIDGLAADTGARTLVEDTQEALARAVLRERALYFEFRKARGALDHEQWNRAIGQALRSDDEDPNPAIAGAAKHWRTTVFDPLKDRAIAAGLLPKDVAADGALSYFTRLYNRPLIEAHPAGFKGIARWYVERELRNAEARAALAAIRGEPAGEAPAEVQNPAERATYVAELVDEIFNAATGRAVDGDVPRDVVAARGPLKGRTLHIPDAEIEVFLESDVEALARRFTRNLAADIELTEMFGSPDLKEQIEAIRREYLQLSGAVRAGVDAETGKPLPELLTPRQKEARIKELAAAEKADIGDIEALRDMLRGRYCTAENTSNFARAARVSGTIDYLRRMGGMTFSSLGEIGRRIMVHGFGNVMRPGLMPLIGRLEGFRMSVEEARLAGAVAERLLNARMASWADITDPYSIAAPFERFMNNTATDFSKFNPMAFWNEFQKSFASVLTQNRVLRGVERYGQLGEREAAYFAFLGIDRPMAERIASQFAAYGTIEDGGARVANSDHWDDDAARRVFRAAINKDLDSTVAGQGPRDVSLFAETASGQLLERFNSVATVGHQQAMMRRLEQRPMGFVSGAIAAVVAGMMISWLQATASDQRGEIGTDPSQWIAGGIERSGLLPLAFEVNNTVEKVFGIGAQGAFNAAFPGADPAALSSRYAGHGLVNGPGAAAVDKLVAIGDRAKAGGKWAESEIDTIRRLVPVATLAGIRSLVEYMGVSGAEARVGQEG